MRASKPDDILPSINCHDSYGKAPLHLAAMSANVEIGTILLQNGAPVDERDHEGYTAFHLATKTFNTDDNPLQGSKLKFCHLLLNYKASLLSEATGGVLPWDLAYNRKDFALMSLILMEGELQACRGFTQSGEYFGNDVLNLAMQEEEWDFVVQLITRGHVTGPSTNRTFLDGVRLGIATAKRLDKSLVKHLLQGDEESSSDVTSEKAWKFGLRKLGFESSKLIAMPPSNQILEQIEFWRRAELLNAAITSHNYQDVSRILRRDPTLARLMFGLDYSEGVRLIVASETRDEELLYSVLHKDHKILSMFLLEHFDRECILDSMVVEEGKLFLEKVYQLGDLIEGSNAEVACDLVAQDTRMLPFLKSMTIARLLEIRSELAEGLKESTRNLFHKHHLQVDYAYLSNMGLRRIHSSITAKLRLEFWNAAESLKQAMDECDYDLAIVLLGMYRELINQLHGLSYADRQKLDYIVRHELDNEVAPLFARAKSLSRIEVMTISESDRDVIEKYANIPEDIDAAEANEACKQAVAADSRAPRVSNSFAFFYDMSIKDTALPPLNVLADPSFPISPKDVSENASEDLRATEEKPRGMFSRQEVIEKWVEHSMNRKNSLASVSTDTTSSSFSKEASEKKTSLLDSASENI
jgi:hypothetical protein